MIVNYTNVKRNMLVVDKILSEPLMVCLQQFKIFGFFSKATNWIHKILLLLKIIGQRADSEHSDNFSVISP